VERPSECTHPLLAELARDVNDFTFRRRPVRAARLAPSVIGLTSDDLRMIARIAARGHYRATGGRGRPAACARGGGAGLRAMLADRTAVRPACSSRRAGEALAAVPDAQRWARGFTREVPIAPKGFRRHAAPNIVRCATRGIAQACIRDPDLMLRELLTATIADCEAWLRQHADEPAIDVGTAEWEGSAVPAPRGWERGWS
jgi:hypothetical protein